MLPLPKTLLEAMRRQPLTSPGFPVLPGGSNTHHASTPTAEVPLVPRPSPVPALNMRGFAGGAFPVANTLLGGISDAEEALGGFSGGTAAAGGFAGGSGPVIGGLARGPTEDAEEGVVASTSVQPPLVAAHQPADSNDGSRDRNRGV